MKKILEIITIIGLVAFLGFGIYFSTRDFYKAIEKETPVVEIHKEEEPEKVEEKPAETPSPQAPVQQEVKKEEVKKPATTVQTTPQKTEEHKTTTSTDGHLVSLGTYKITAYCACAKCCGKTNGITASGTKVQAGRTIAAPKNFPFGTKLMINGHIYTVEDRGGAIQGNRIDIYFNTHEEALQWGVKYLEVFKVNE